MRTNGLRPRAIGALSVVLGLLGSFEWDVPAGPAIVIAASTIFIGSRQYGNWLGLDLGVHYERDGAFVPDDAPADSAAVRG